MTINMSKILVILIRVIQGYQIMILNYRGEQAEITAHIADFREHYAIGLKFDETLQAYKWADGTTPADWGFSNWGSGDPGQ